MTWSRPTVLNVGAQGAFTDSLEWFGLAGAGVTAVAALAVWLLTPRDLDLSAAEH